MKDPVDHILRPALPWRGDEGAITECGLNASKAPTITRAEFLARWKDLGQQRTALLTCMTCADTARRWSTWDDDPRLAVQREIAWERPGFAAPRRRDNRGERLRDELVAISRLIEAHQDEFDALVQDVRGKREWNARKAAAGRRS